MRQTRDERKRMRAVTKVLDPETSAKRKTRKVRTPCAIFSSASQRLSVGRGTERAEESESQAAGRELQGRRR
jgi:hypothetical protein